MDSNVRLKALISDSDKKQKAIASEIGISPSTLSNYVTGVSKIPGDIAAKLAIYFNVTADYLLGLSDYPEKPVILSQTEQDLIAKLRVLTGRRKRRQALATLGILLTLLLATTGIMYAGRDKSFSV